MPIFHHKPKFMSPPKRRPPPTGSTATKLAQRMEALQEAEDTRQVFVQCSGMHSPYVKWIVEQMCFRTWWVRHPGSCADFVLPALTQGIPTAWENLVAGMSEIAVYSSLFMTIYVGMSAG